MPARLWRTLKTRVQFSPIVPIQNRKKREPKIGQIRERALSHIWGALRIGSSPVTPPGLIERLVLVLHISDHLRGKHLFSTRYMSVSLALLGTFDRSIALPVFNSQDKVVARCQGEILKKFILKREKDKASENK
jgi:hypothetical protein